MAENKKYENSKVHYFEDGNILLIAESTIFKVHRGILAHSSVVFNDMFKIATEDDARTPEITLAESASELELLLSFMYPPKVRINWQIIQKLLQLADKYIIESIPNDVKNFLELRFHEKPIVSLIVAEKHSFSQIYKKSFMLVLDELLESINVPNFIDLSKETIIKLQKCWFIYIQGLGQLNDLYSMTFIPRRQHTCGERKAHNSKINDKIEEKLQKIHVFPPPRPSEVLEDLLDLHSLSLGYSDDHIISAYLDRNIEKCLGKFERLDLGYNSKFNGKSDRNYLSFD
ncbi:13979_t:CDS:1 [Ambispora leptoticha]|uniref:13979_t:CDS:1 n=1 Tax=Ambispora leptoticha TaxID=144679 RepID=A0A9N9AY05_9GLOM|nr:13979_t:CDS:1 [Ambispora leptoticha]